MAWEPRRNGRTYYYRKQRRGGRVVSEYVGTGLAGTLGELYQARADAHTADARAQRAREIAALPPDDPALADLETLLAGLTRAVLLANGYHPHKRQWRKR